MLQKTFSFEFLFYLLKKIQPEIKIINLTTIFNKTCLHQIQKYDDMKKCFNIIKNIFFHFQRTKIEKFRAHLPVLHTLCNPGEFQLLHFDFLLNNILLNEKVLQNHFECYLCILLQNLTGCFINSLIGISIIIVFKLCIFQTKILIISKSSWLNENSLHWRLQIQSNSQNTFSNYLGLRDRHWAQICLANGGDIAHGAETRWRVKTILEWPNKFHFRISNVTMAQVPNRLNKIT